MPPALPWVHADVEQRRRLDRVGGRRPGVPADILTTPERNPATPLTCGSARQRALEVRAEARWSRRATAPLLITKSALSAESMVELTEALAEDGDDGHQRDQRHADHQCRGRGAVRDGLRIAFCWPSLPAVPCTRQRGADAPGWPGARRTVRAPRRRRTPPPRRRRRSGTRFAGWPNRPTPARRRRRRPGSRRARCAAAGGGAARRPRPASRRPAGSRAARRPARSPRPA